MLRIVGKRSLADIGWLISRYDSRPRRRADRPWDGFQSYLDFDEVHSSVRLTQRETFLAKYELRPLQRTLETLIVAPLSRFMIENRIKEFTTLRLVLSTDRQSIVIRPVAESSVE